MLCQSEARFERFGVLGVSSTDTINDSQRGDAGFGALLLAFRDAAELTQEELSERSGVSVRAISDLERGVKTRPQRATVQLLAEGLKLTTEQRAAFDAAVPNRRRRRVTIVPTIDLPVGGFLGALPDAPLVGREGEIERIRELVDEVVNGTGRLILLSGEPGVGKTRLAQQTTVICRARGMHFAAGRCSQPQQTMAYYPWLEIVERLVTIARGRLTSDPVKRWPQLRALLPSGMQYSSSGDHTGDQPRLHWAVSNLLEDLSRVMPLVIAVDDLQWADQASLDLVQHLVRKLRHVPVLLLGTYRDMEIGRRHPLRSILRDLHREHLADEIEVTRFSPEDTKALMASTLGAGNASAEFVDLVQRQSQGNAFYVQEIVRALMERGELEERKGEWHCRTLHEITIPHTVQEAVRERLSRLSERVQETLREASVFGETFYFDELQEMADLTEDDLDDVLDEAVQARILRTGRQDSYAFYHALTQLVLYQDVTPRKRRLLHLAAGNAIEEQPRTVREQRAAELAWHFREAGERDRALQYSALAGDQSARRYAHAEAESHYQVALDLARQLGDVSLEASVLEKLGWVQTNYGRYTEARIHLEEAASLYSQLGDKRGEARVTVQLGSVHRALGSSEDGISSVRDLLSRLSDDDFPSEVTELNVVLETVCYSTGHYEEGLAASERAATLAKATGDLSALARAETGRGTELTMLSNLEDGIDTLERAIVLPGADEDPFNLSRAMENLSQAHLLRGNAKRSIELVQKSLEIAEHIQSPWDTAMAQYSAGAAYRLSGDWIRARIFLEECDRLHRNQAPSWWAVYGILELSAFCLDEGYLVRAAALSQEALEIANRCGHLEGVRAAQRLLAEIDLWETRAAAARDRLKPLMDREGLVELQVTELLPTLAAAYEACGDTEQAEHAIDEAVRRARDCGARLVLAHALTVRGKILSGRQRWGEAKNDFDEAIALSQRMPCPHLEGRALYEWGSMLATRGDRELAREPLMSALSIFERLGAKPYIGPTRQALQSLDD